MRVEEVHDRARLVALKEPWRALFDRAKTADPFQSWEWIVSWLDCFWQDRDIAFLFAWDGDELKGVAPLLDDKGAEVGCSGALAMPVNSHARRLDVLFDGDAEAVLGAFVDHVRGSGRKMRLTFRHAPEESPIVAALPNVARAKHLAATKMTSNRASPIVRIESSWDDYLQTRSSQVRRELQRKVRRVERDWKAEWVIASEPADCARAMDDVRRIERTSWKEQEGTSLTAELEAVRLYDAFWPRFAAAGWLRLYLLHLNGQPVAHILGAEVRGEYYAFKTSYDDAFKKASPGQALFFYALKDAFDRKLKAFDFLGDESRWKGELANAARKHVDVCAHAALDAGCVWHELKENSLKPFARKVAPKLVALRHPGAKPAEPVPPPPVEAPVAPAAARKDDSMREVG